MLPLPPVGVLPPPEIVICVGSAVSNVTETRLVGDEPEEPVADAPEGMVRVRGATLTPAWLHDSWYSVKWAKDVRRRNAHC